MPLFYCFQSFIVSTSSACDVHFLWTKEFKLFKIIFTCFARLLHNSSLLAFCVVATTPSKILACTQISDPSLVFSLTVANTQAHSMSFLEFLWPLLLVGLTVVFWHVCVSYNVFNLFLVVSRVVINVYDLS